VERDDEDLRNAALPRLVPGDWLDRARRLRQVYPDLSGEGYANFADAALDLFIELDQSELALWAVTKIGRDVPAGLLAGWREAGEWFHDHAIDFFPAADYAEKLVNRYRADLSEYDFRLYEITGKYFHLVLKSDELSDLSGWAAGLREEWKERNCRETERIIRLFHDGGQEVKIAAAARKNACDNLNDLGVEFTLSDRICRGNIKLETGRRIVFLQYGDAEGDWPVSGEIRIGKNGAVIDDTGKAVFKIEEIMRNNMPLPDPILILDGRSHPGIWLPPVES
jgi:hypothetical protein